MNLRRTSSVWTLTVIINRGHAVTMNGVELCTKHSETRPYIRRLYSVGMSNGGWHVLVTVYANVTSGRVTGVISWQHRINHVTAILTVMMCVSEKLARTLHSFLLPRDATQCIARFVSKSMVYRERRHNGAFLCTMVRVFLRARSHQQFVEAASRKQQVTRKLCYRKDVRAMHNPTICSWFEARKSICTI